MSLILNRQQPVEQLSHQLPSSLATVSLRSFAQADLPALFELDQACFAPGIAYSQAELTGFLQHPGSFTAVAVEEGCQAPVGFAIVRVLSRKGVRLSFNKTIPVLHVLTIDVAPSARRRGIGALLMEWICLQAVELGSRIIALEVAADNLAAQHFYASHGFTRTGTIPGYYNGKTDAFTLERPMPRTY